MARRSGNRRGRPRWIQCPFEADRQMIPVDWRRPEDPEGIPVGHWRPGDNVRATEKRARLGLEPDRAKRARPLPCSPCSPTDDDAEGEGGGSEEYVCTTIAQEGRQRSFGYVGQ